MKLTCLCLLIFLTVPQISFSQFTLSGEIRPRYEFRNGFQTLSSPDQQFGSFTDQRTRINFNFKNEDYIFKVIVQDVRVWGSQSQLVANDGALTTLHEAWAEILLNSKFSFKLGRQEIIYDDHRIFGSVAWAQQARSHDALLIKYKNNEFKADFGFAFNQDGPISTNTFYTVNKSYKAFQYLWLHHEKGSFKGSFLFLNNGLQGGDLNDYRTLYSQTTGLRLIHSKNNLFAALNYYHQSGKGTDERKIDANLLGIDVSYQISPKATPFVGFEMISGNDQENPDIKNQAFNPFYGTNHKFNGYMDYFYVGNHLNNVGLNDFYFGTKATLSKMKLYAAFHFFSSNGNVLEESGPDTMSRNLGQELDITFSFNLNKEIGFQGGYSHLFATETMEAIKGGSKEETNNWAWAMITIKPVFFQSKKLPEN